MRQIPVLLLLAALVFAGGMWIGRSMPAGAPSPSPGIATDPELLAAVRDLAAELRADREGSVLDHSEPRPRQPIEPDSSRTDRLVAAVEALVTRLEADQVRGALGPSPANRAAEILNAKGYRSLADVAARFPRQPEVPAEFEKVQSDLKDAHLLWTVTQVLTRYGAPSRIGTGDSSYIDLRYDLTGFGNDPDYDPDQLHFTIAQGVVINCRLEW